MARTGRLAWSGHLRDARWKVWAQIGVSLAACGSAPRCCSLALLCHTLLTCFGAWEGKGGCKDWEVFFPPVLSDCF